MTETIKKRRPRRMAREAEAAPIDSANAASAMMGPASGGILASIASKPQTKASLVVDLLSRDDGASLTELCEATGWLPHTCRAFLTGLRKRGKMPEKAKREDGITTYRLVLVEIAA